MKGFTISLFAFLFFSFNLSSQSVQEIIAATRSAYVIHENLSMNVSVLNYATSASASATLVGNGKMSKTKNGYYSKFMNTELVSNKTCTVVIDHDMKEITFLPAGKKDLRKMDFISSLDSLSASYDSVIYRGVINGDKLLVFFGNDQYVIKTEVYISASTSLIDKIVYYYAPDTEDDAVDAFKTEIIYKDVSFESIDESVFSEEKFIVLINKQWKPVAAYKNYHITVVAKPAP
jgi:hypothetical protein